MIKIVTLVLLVSGCARADSDAENVRQKRLLFFDETGTLVKTYPNPYLNHLTLKSDSLPFYGNFLNPFLNFIKNFGESIAAFAIPVSNAIIQQIKKDPNFQNSLVIIPKNPVVEPNPSCQGKRTQIPSPSLCNNFLNCWDGWAFEQECPSGLLFSDEGYCDYAGNVDCHNRKLNYDKIQPQPICSKDFEAFRNKDNCNEFFVCVNRQPVKFKCPADLAYSQYLGVCDYADRVGCENSNVPQQSYPSVPQVPNPAPIPVTIPPAPVTSSPISSPPSLPEAPPSDIPSIPSLPSPNLPVPSSPENILPSLPPSPSPIKPPTFPFIPPPSQPPPSPPSLEIRPLPIQFQPEPPKATDEKPAIPQNIFAPGCAHAHTAMSRQDAISQLQAHTTY